MLGPVIPARAMIAAHTPCLTFSDARHAFQYDSARCASRIAYTSRGGWPLGLTDACIASARRRYRPQSLPKPARSGAGGRLARPERQRATGCICRYAREVATSLGCPVVPSCFSAGRTAHPDARSCGHCVLEALSRVGKRETRRMGRDHGARRDDGAEHAVRGAKRLLRSYRRLQGPAPAGERRRNDEHSKNGHQRTPTEGSSQARSSSFPRCASSRRSMRSRRSRLRDAIQRLAGDCRPAEVRSPQSRDRRSQHAVSARPSADGRRDLSRCVHDRENSWIPQRAS